jgi:hypothetical protein
MSDKIDFQSLSFGMRRFGWIRFWVQSILGVVVGAVLLFSNVVNNSDGQLGLAPGLSLLTTLEKSKTAPTTTPKMD